MAEYYKQYNIDEINLDLKKNYSVVISWHKEEPVVSEKL